MSILIKAGKLVSTTDMKLARKLQQIVNIEDITKGSTPEKLRQTRKSLSFMIRGEYYELEA